MRKKGGGFAAVGIGFVLVIVCTVLLFKNEGRAVNRSRALSQIKNAVEISSEDTSIADGEMILISEKAVGQDILKDDEFGVVAPEGSIKFSKDVSMYQWKETSKTKDDKTTYTYEKEWSKMLINSSNFNESGSHQNPTSMAYASENMMSEQVKMGAYSLEKVFIKKLNVREDLDVGNVKTDSKMTVQGNTIFVSGNGKSTLTSPEVGDYKIEYSYVPANVYTVLGAKKGTTVITYHTKNGDLAEVTVGTMDKDGLKAEKVSDNKNMTLGFRVALIIGIIIANAMIASPITNLLGHIPFLGKIANGGIGIMGFVMGLSWSLIVIAFGWIAYRPIVGIGLLAIVAGLIFLTAKKFGGKEEKLITE